MLKCEKRTGTALEEERSEDCRQQYEPQMYARQAAGHLKQGNRKNPLRIENENNFQYLVIYYVENNRCPSSPTCWITFYQRS